MSAQVSVRELRELGAAPAPEEPDERTEEQKRYGVPRIHRPAGHAVLAARVASTTDFATAEHAKYGASGGVEPGSLVIPDTGIGSAKPATLTDEHVRYGVTSVAAKPNGGRTAEHDKYGATNVR